MTRGILIAGNESALLDAVCAEAAGRVEQYASAVIPGPFPASPSDDGKTGAGQGKILLSWNPSSALSARTLVMAAENRLGRVDDAILICSPPPVYRPAESLDPAETDRYINDQFKPWFFLVRELALVFKTRQGGTLVLAAPEISTGTEKDAPGKDVPSDLPGLSAASSFRALAQGLLTSSGGAFKVMGFTGCETGNEAEFAAWLFKTLDEGGRKNSGRWHKYPKLPFFK